MSSTCVCIHKCRERLGVGAGREGSRFRETKRVRERFRERLQGHRGMVFVDIAHITWWTFRNLVFLICCSRVGDMEEGSFRHVGDGQASVGRNPCLESKLECRKWMVA